MPDVAGGGTQNVTVYDEDGRPLVIDAEGKLAVLDQSVVTALGDTGGDTATGARGWLRRIFDRLALLVVRDEIAYYASALGGRVAFNVTTSLVNIGSAGEHPLALMVNPVNSGVDIYLDLGEFGASQNTTFRRIRNAAYTIVGAATGAVPVNMGGGSAASPLRMYRGGSSGSEFTFTGGNTAKNAHISAYNQYLTHLKGRVVLRPGQALLWAVAGSSALGTSFTASVFFEFWQKPAEA